MSNPQAFVKSSVIGAALLAATGAANATTVTFSDFSSAFPSLFLASGAPVVLDDMATPGSVLLSLEIEDFVASGGGDGSDSVKFDTIAFSVSVPSGFVITKIEYKEKTTTSLDDGVGISTGSLSANGVANPLGLHLHFGDVTMISDALTTSFTYDMADAVNLINVVITNSLTAVAFPGGSASVAKSGPDLLDHPTFEVTLAAVPLPPAVWMLGSALVGLTTVGRRKLGM